MDRGAEDQPVSVVYTQNSRDQMASRNISEAEVESVIDDHHTHYHDRDGNDIYVGHPAGRRIKVVVAKNSDPPRVITAAD